MEYVTVQEIMLDDIQQVRQNGNHLDLISRTNQEIGFPQDKVKVCMDYNNEENFEKLVIRLKEFCSENGFPTNEN